MAKNNFAFKTTKDLPVAKKIIDRVIGQDKAVDVMKKAAQQRRHVLLIGEPGTGKSMLGLALTEMLPKEKLVDVVAFPNPNDDHQPLIRSMPAGKGREYVLKSKLQSMSMLKNQNLIFIIFLIFGIVFPIYYWRANPLNLGETANAIIFSASIVTSIIVLALIVVSTNLNKRMEKQSLVPKVIVDNYGKKQAPFFDATGAHAGALLGDVLHDPFQTFSYISILKCILKENINDEQMAQALDKYWHKPYIHKEFKQDKKYEAVFLPKNELNVMGENNNLVAPVEVLSSNRYDYKGEMIKLKTTQQKELLVTPEHKIAVQRQGETQYIEACKLKKGDTVLSLNENMIIDEQDIIDTYDLRQQEQCRLYYQYLEIKKQNPAWGYKRIAKSMGQKIGKTRWWHAEKHIPVPIQTANWLKEQGLLPLTYDNPNLSIIAKILGATFGDGGIFENLNGIFLSSKEKCNVEEFGSDLETIFGLKKGENSRIIEGGEFGHSWCYQNTNRNIIRFFIALKSPVGKKSSQNIIIPAWIYRNKNLKMEFFSSLLGSEAGVPGVHISKTQLNTFDFAITGEEGLENNRINFLEKIKDYLNSVNIKTGKISTRIVKTKKSDKGSILYRFLISTEFQNMINFSKECKLNYCNYKRDKLTEVLNEFRIIKKERYEFMLKNGMGAETAMKKLNLTPKALYEILNDTEFIVKEPEAAYT
ncbi:ATP-binding protein [Candidatus Woesearchaeota archaeon]|nr:ATP-binding protein [Candidatus Woesearchaeota archaeon]